MGRTPPGATAALRRWRGAVARWFDGAAVAHGRPADDDRIDWLRVVPFIGMHAMCLDVLWAGTSAVALAVALALYAVRMFALTGFYHRYFAHKAFRTARATQFVFAVVGASCVQRGPLWWAAHHREHHRHADRDGDLHSPLRRGLWWSHMGWFLTPRAFRTRWEAIPDWRDFPELRWLDRYDIAVPVALATALFLAGHAIGAHWPASGTSGTQLLVWGFFVSTVVLFHATVTINSLAHRFGTRRFATRDNSRNNWLLALLTFGEGWHNNHHHFPGSARQGFRWWEIDLTWYVLRALAAVGVVWDLKPVPEFVRAGSDADDAGPSMAKRNGAYRAPDAGRSIAAPHPLAVRPSIPRGERPGNGVPLRQEPADAGRTGASDPPLAVSGSRLGVPVRRLAAP